MLQYPFYSIKELSCWNQLPAMSCFCEVSRLATAIPTEELAQRVWLPRDIPHSYSNQGLSQPFLNNHNRIRLGSHRDDFLFAIMCSTVVLQAQLILQPSNTEGDGISRYKN